MRQSEQSGGAALLTARGAGAAGARDGCPQPFGRMPQRKGEVRPLRSAASSSRADEEEDAAAAQAAEEARCARRALTSAGTDAGAVPPQARRRSSIACFEFPLPRYLRDGRMDISLAVTAMWAFSGPYPAPHCYAMSAWGILDGFHLLLFNRAVGAKINGI
jgi:hypothetical protein